MSRKIDLFLNETYLSHGIAKWVPWELEQAPHGLIIGQSGSGKTYSAKLLLAKLYLTTHCELYVLDYKSDVDFDYLSGCKNFYRYSACKQGLSDFYEKFIKRQEGYDKSRHPLVLFYDEWQNYCNANEKKSIEEDKKKLGVLVSLGRSFACHVIISQQTAHAEYFNQFRTNFSMVLGMGNLSDESRKMLFPDYATDLLPDRHRGTGYIAFNGTKPIPIVVPKIRNRLLVQNTIKEAVGIKQA